MPFFQSWSEIIQTVFMVIFVILALFSASKNKDLKKSLKKEEKLEFKILTELHNADNSWTSIENTPKNKKVADNLHRRQIIESHGFTNNKPLTIHKSVNFETYFRELVHRQDKNLIKKALELFASTSDFNN